MHHCCSPSSPQTPALLLIDVQEGFHDSYWGHRNNPKFEANVSQLLQAWRSQRREIIHVQHLSTEADSPLAPGKDGTAFMDFAQPFPNERIFSKSVNSAFIGTDLEQYLKEAHIHNLVIVGLSTDHCVSTSTRMAANLGFKVFLVSDATATFERRGITSELYPADLVHAVSLASLAHEFAELKTTEEALKL